MGPAQYAALGPARLKARPNHPSLRLDEGLKHLYFKVYGTDPIHYSMAINTGSASIDGAVEAIAAFLGMAATGSAAKQAGKHPATASSARP